MWKSYLNKHVADVFVTALTRRVKRGAFILRLHLKVRVDTVHWKVTQRYVFVGCGSCPAQPNLIICDLLMWKLFITTFEGFLG